MTTKQRIITTLLALVLLISVGTAIALVVKNGIEESGIETLEEETLDNYIISSPTPDAPDVPESDGYVFDWASLLATNSDVVGWIRFDTPERINYPIVQGRTNQDYLNRDWTGAYRSSGSIFLHKDNAPNFTDMNSIVYGHRMNSGSMFGTLPQYKSQKFMSAHPYFYIYTPDGQKRTYEAFVFAEVQDGSYAYSTSFESKEDKLKYFETMKVKAITSRPVELDEFSTIATLSTCSYKGIRRLILQGKLINIEMNQTP